MGSSPRRARRSQAPLSRRGSREWGEGCLHAAAGPPAPWRETLPFPQSCLGFSPEPLLSCDPRACLPPLLLVQGTGLDSDALSPDCRALSLVCEMTLCLPSHPLSVPQPRALPTECDLSVRALLRPGPGPGWGFSSACLTAFCHSPFIRFPVVSEWVSLLRCPGSPVIACHLSQDS